MKKKKKKQWFFTRTCSERYVPCLKFAVEFKGCALIPWPWQDPPHDTNTRSPTNPLRLTLTLSCIFPCRLQLCPPVLHCGRAGRECAPSQTPRNRSGPLPFPINLHFAVPDVIPDVWIHLSLSAGLKQRGGQSEFSWHSKSKEEKRGNQFL